MQVKNMISALLFLPILCFGEVPVCDYDLHLFSIPGKRERIMICFHGYGANYQIAQAIQSWEVTDVTFLSFNFPDHDIEEREDYDPCQATFGTIDELLPALYVLKQVV